MKCFEEVRSEKITCGTSCHGLYADIVNTSFPTFNDQELSSSSPHYSFSLIPYQEWLDKLILEYNNYKRNFVKNIEFDKKEMKNHYS